MSETDHRIPDQLSPEEVRELKRNLIDDPELMSDVCRYMTLETLEAAGGAGSFGSPREYAARAVTLGIKQHEALKEALELSGEAWPLDGMAGPASVAAALSKVEELRDMRDQHG